LNRFAMLTVCILLALPAAAVEFEQVGAAVFQHFQQPHGAAARALGGGLAAGWDEPGFARWSPAAPPAPRIGSALGAAYEEPEISPHVDLGWSRWSAALRADLGDVSVSLLRDGWTSDPVLLRTAYDPEGTQDELKARQEIGAVSWRTKTWRGAGGETVLTLGAGFRHLHLDTGTPVGLDEVDLGAALTRRAADPQAPGLAGWSVGAAATHLRGEAFELGDLEAEVSGHRRLGARAVWKALPQRESGRPLLTVTTLADWERARRDGWDGGGSVGLGVETLWAGFAAFRYGWRDRPDDSLYASGSFGFGLRASLLDDRLHLRGDVAVVDLNEDLGYDTLEVYAVRVGWTP